MPVMCGLRLALPGQASPLTTFFNHTNGQSLPKRISGAPSFVG